MNQNRSVIVEKLEELSTLTSQTAIFAARNGVCSIFTREALAPICLRNQRE